MISKILAESFGLEEDDPKVLNALAVLNKVIRIDIKGTEKAIRNKEMDELRASGKSVKEIAVLYGVSRQTCHSVIRKELFKRKCK